MVAKFLRLIAEFIGDVTFGIGKLITGPILVAFYEWDRKSELSADRAGLLGIQNPDVVITTLMKLAGGCQKVFEQFDKDQFLRQADSYRELDESALNQFYKFLQVVFRDHPFPALRAREIHDWAASTEYKNIMDGIYPRLDMDYYTPPSYASYDFSGSRGAPGGYTAGYSRGYSTSPASTTCPNCGVSVETSALFCHVCGAKIIGAIAVVDKPGTGEPPGKEEPPSPPRPDKTPRCKICGAALKPSDDYCPSCGLNTRIDG
jgi:hypothetical protein